MKERLPNFVEKTGIYARNGGIIAGILGLITRWEILVAGVLVAGSGEIVRRVGRGKNEPKGNG